MHTTHASVRSTPDLRLKKVPYSGVLARVGVMTSLCLAAVAAFAQASQPVESSVFTHHVQVDDGPESGAINDNWKYITSPPAKPVAASAPTAGDGQRHGRGGGRGGGGMGGHGMKGMSNASNDTSNPPPSNPATNAPAAPGAMPGAEAASSPHADTP